MLQVVLSCLQYVTSLQKEKKNDALRPKRSIVNPDLEREKPSLFFIIIIISHSTLIVNTF